jgi:hypothetical protein
LNMRPCQCIERCRENGVRMFQCRSVIFIGKEFVRISQNESKKKSVITYYDWAGIGSIRTLSPSEKKMSLKPLGIVKEIIKSIGIGLSYA